ncbi:MAG: hypothetical protein D4S01_08795 [Dehalococcoidia bacterium]|nr:MAG: hypothetical protein D4S01_08795 [Dehalococcoidia bacterium]
MVTKKELKGEILPVLRKKYMDSGAKEVYEAFDIKGYEYGDMFEMFTVHNKVIQSGELDSYYRRNHKTYDWKQIMEWSYKNASKLDYKFTRFPKNKKICAVKHKSATSVLFSPTAMNTIAHDNKMFICPLYEDFILFTEKETIDEFVEFVRTVKAMNFSIFQSGKTKKYIGDTIFIYDPKINLLSTINTEKEFGCRFNVVTLNMSSDNINKQIRSEATNIVKDNLRGMPFDQICEVATNKELQDTLVDGVEDEIKRVLENGKNSK